MATAREYLAALAAEIGTTEDPPGSNCNPYSAELGRPCERWCADGLVAMAARVGLYVPGSASTRTMAKQFAKRGQYHPAGEAGFTPKPGDFVFWDWPDRSTGIQHVECVESVPDRSHLIDIGFNTSADDGGSQDNGGGVFRRHRSTTYVVGYGRPDYTPEDDMASLDHILVNKPDSKTVWLVAIDPALGLGVAVWRCTTTTQVTEQVRNECKRRKDAGRTDCTEADVRIQWPGSRLDPVVAANNLGDLP